MRLALANAPGPSGYEACQTRMVEPSTVSDNDDVAVNENFVAQGLERLNPFLILNYMINKMVNRPVPPNFLK